MEAGEALMEAVRYLDKKKEMPVYGDFVRFKIKSSAIEEYKKYYGSHYYAHDVPELDSKTIYSCNPTKFTNGRINILTADGHTLGVLMLPTDMIPLTEVKFEDEAPFYEDTSPFYDEWCF